MAVKLKVIANYPTDAPNTVKVQAVFSGSYVTGGDTLNLNANNFTDPGLIGLIGPFDNLPIEVTSHDAGTDGYYSEPIPGATLATYKLRLWQPGGTEVAAGAYGAPWTNTSPACVVTLHINLALQDQ